MLDYFQKSLTNIRRRFLIEQEIYQNKNALTIDKAKSILKDPGHNYDLMNQIRHLESFDHMLERTEGIHPPNDLDCIPSITKPRLTATRKKLPSPRNHHQKDKGDPVCEDLLPVDNHRSEDMFHRLSDGSYMSQFVAIGHEDNLCELARRLVTMEEKYIQLRAEEEVFIVYSSRTYKLTGLICTICLEEIDSASPTRSSIKSSSS